VFATTRREDGWPLIVVWDDEERGEHRLMPGRHELERIRCPLGHDCYWLVLKGTKIGMAEAAWRQHAESSGNMQITIEE
jgi:hypothetical protein